MSENWKIQVSPKIGDTLVNLRAEHGQEMNSILTWATENAAEIIKAVQALQAAGNVAAVLPVAGVTVEQAYHQALPEQPQGGWNTSAPTPPPQWAPQATQQAGMYAPAQTGQYAPQHAQPGNSAAQPGPAPGCPHGQMNWRADKNNPPRWGGFFCPAQKGDPSKCATQYAFSENR